MKTLILLIPIAFLIITGCSNHKSSTEIFNDAEKLTAEGKIPEAAIQFETLLKEYPNDKLAPEVTARLAAIYQNKQVKNISETESLKKSVALFKSIYDKYPKSEQAPTGLFMAGFVEANELHDYDAATKTYNFFIKLFPGHELVTSAKEELDNMGLTPEEILQKNMARQQ